MASGYVVAAILEAAGLIGLVIALVNIQTERRARAAELRGFLRSGQTSGPASDATGPRWPMRFGARVVVLPVAPGGMTPRHESAARAALGRAILRSGQQVRPDFAAPVSAG